MRVELYGCLYGTAGGNGFVYYFKDNTRTDLSILITVYYLVEIKDLILMFYI